MEKLSTAPEPRQANGQFVMGHKGGPGRPSGSRPKLSELFWRDLHAVWQEEGRTVMERLARDDPAAFAKIAAMCVLKPDEAQREASAVTVVNVITGVPRSEAPLGTRIVGPNGGVVE